MCTFETTEPYPISEMSFNTLGICVHNSLQGTKSMSQQNRRLSHFQDIWSVLKSWIVVYMYITLAVMTIDDVDFLFQERLAESHKEHESLIQVVSKLEDQLREVRGQLDQEKHNCRLAIILNLSIHV